VIGSPEANEASDIKSNIVSVYDVFALCKLNQKCLNTTVIDEHVINHRSNQVEIEMKVKQTDTEVPG
jgi:hypothetical protein